MIDYQIKSGNPDKQHTACVVVPLFKGRKLSPPAKVIDGASDGALKRFLKRGDIEGEAGESAWLYDLDNIACDRVLLIGCGSERDIDSAAYARICGATAKLLNHSGAVDAVSYLSAIDNRHLDQLSLVRDTVINFQPALYRFNEFKTKPEKVKKPLKRLTISVPSRKDLFPGEQAMREGLGIALGVKLAKDLANLPPNICHPTYLAKRAIQLQKTYPKLDVTIVDEAEMTQLGMGALLSVSRGSRQPAKLICMQYNGAPESDCQPIVLVGKGVTFDTGGISIKPSPGMDEMKYDMGGAASVFGTIVAAVDTQLPVNLVGIVAAAENMPDGDASRPGDIVTTMSGQTVEILNTDAEGRLVLCDALTYAARFNPDVVIDIATLTGACIVALGHHASGMLTNHSPLGRELTRASKGIGDKIWELPLWPEYAEQLKSNFADMANIGGKSAGTITAAAFLSKFTSEYHWAHLDIAGTAWKSGAEKGATGRPVPLLTEFILQRLKHGVCE